MEYTTDNNFISLPATSINLAAVYNDTVYKLENGRTIRRTANIAITQYKCITINSQGQAIIATDTSNICGIWQASTLEGGEGFGQIDGTITDVSWTWTPGNSLYCSSAGDLTETESLSGIIVAIALSATKIILTSRSSTISKTIIAPGTVGAQTIHKIAGRVNIDIGQTSLVVTNNLVTSNSIILTNVASSGDTFGYIRVVAATGYFTLYTVAHDVETAINWLVIN